MGHCDIISVSEIRRYMFSNAIKTTNSGSGSGSFGSPLGGFNQGVAIAIVVVAFLVTVVVFALLVEKKKAPRASFLRWMREYLNFRSILIAGIIKFAYLFMAILITLIGIVMMFSGNGETVLAAIGTGLGIIVFGNIFLRLVMEMMMITIGLWENTSDIRAVLVKDEEKPDEKLPTEVKENKPEKVEVIAEQAKPVEPK